MPLTLKNFYKQGWTPGADTLAYFPFESDAIDQIGSFTTTPTSVTYTTVGGVKSAHVGTTGGIGCSPTNIITTSLPEMTISVWLYVTIQQDNKRRMILEFATQGNCHILIALRENTTKYRFAGNNAGTELYSSDGAIVANSRNHLVFTNSSDGKNIYVNGVLNATGTGSSTPRGNRANSYQQGQYIMCGRDGVNYGESVNGNIKDMIFEKVVRTAQEIQDYYDQTKSLYGIS